MEDVTIKQLPHGQQAFTIEEDGTQLGEMVMSIAGGTMTVYHTEVAPEAEGRGLAKILLNSMVTYAREHTLKVIPLCVFVQAQFKRHPDMYSDIWLKS